MLITVEDNGSGMDLDRVGEDLFKPYKRFHTEKEGKGLGLFLVKGHVESLGGLIEVQSHKGKGSRFAITLPLSYATMLLRCNGSMVYARIVLP